MPSPEEIEAAARAIYEQRHKGLKNVWSWVDVGLDVEHPGCREATIASAIAALTAAEKVRGNQDWIAGRDAAAEVCLNGTTEADPYQVLEVAHYEIRALQPPASTS